MVERFNCIALRTVRISDSRNLLSAWSDRHGLVSLAISAGSGRESRRRRALTMPLSLFEVVTDIRPGNDIYTAKEMMPLAGSPGMSMSAARIATASMIAEALDTILRRGSADEALSAYLFDALVFYGEADSRAAGNFVISFFYHLTHFMGISPDTTQYRPGMYFDMNEGRFTKAQPLHHHYLGTADTRVMAALGKIPLRRCGLLRLPRYGRRLALDHILHYYSLHLSTPESLKSLEILRQIFD